MTEDEVLSEFRSCGALLEGHFLLSSGRHSAHYLQCARVLMNADRAGRIAVAMAKNLPREIRSAVDVVISPAMGGLIIGHEMGRALGKDAMFLERPEGTFHLRRGFAIKPGAKVLMVEDVVTTGLPTRGTKFPHLCRRGSSRRTGCGSYHQAGQPCLMANVHNPGRLRLGVNIDHVATIRNARGGDHPDPVRAAEIVARVGGDGITAHLREDRRHIRDEDLARIQAATDLPLNLEMAATEEMLEIALRHRPHAACIVPEKREERTTEGGLDAAGLQ